MPERERDQPPEGAQKAIGLAQFMLRRKATLRALFHGKLFEPVEGSTAKHRKEWRNVAEHCVSVARALDDLGTLLGLPHDVRESMVHVGFMHDWNKRLTKDGDAFTDAESRDAERYARAQLEKYDPDGLLFAATEPHGLARLETPDATMAEHCVHLIDLSCMPEGIVPPEKRIEDIVHRRKAEGIDHDNEYPDFWKRKKALALREEEAMIAALRARGIAVPENARLCDVLNGALKKA